MSREPDGKVALTVAGRRYRFPAVVEPVLGILAEERSLTVGELGERAGVGTEIAAQAVSALARHHLVLIQG